MTDTFNPTPAARLIEARRRARGISVRRAALDAELSEGRWRQIAKGYQQAAKGLRVPVNAPDETLARMAVAVGVDPDAMASLGSESVAEVMVLLTDAAVRDAVQDVQYVDAALQNSLKEATSRAESVGTVPLKDASEEELVRELYRRVLNLRAQATLGSALNETDQRGRDGGSGGDTAANTDAEGTSARKDQSLTRPDQGVVPENFDLAAYAMPPGGSMKQRLDRAQDKAAEAPDAEGSEYGA